MLLSEQIPERAALLGLKYPHYGAHSSQNGRAPGKSLTLTFPFFLPISLGYSVPHVKIVLALPIVREYLYIIRDTNKPGRKGQNET